jgi:lactoylglutathione lyase
MEILGTHHVAIYTRNFERMEQFYTQTLGFPVTMRWDEDRIIFIDMGSTRIELLGRDTLTGDPHALGKGVGLNHIALLVADVDRAFQELRELGVDIASGPSDFRTVRIAFFRDPDGNVLELWQERDAF